LPLHLVPCVRPGQQDFHRAFWGAHRLTFAV
jgi:hypothetical protein